MNFIDIYFFHCIQSLPISMLPIAKAFTFIGSPPVLFCIILYIMYVVDYKTGLELVFLLGIGTIISGVVKTSLRLPRPFEISSEVKAYSYSSSFNGYALPSLTVQNSSILYSAVFNTRKIIQLLLIIILISAISLSQVFLGEHSILQVSGSIILGVLILYGVGRIKHSHFFKHMLMLPEKTLFLYIFVFSLILTLCTISNTIIFNDFSFHSYGSNFEKLHEIFYSTGLLTGAAFGGIRFIRRFTIKHEKRFMMKNMRFITALLFSLALLLPVERTIQYIAHFAVSSHAQFFGNLYFTYILYGSYGYLVTFILPIIFHKMKIMRLNFNYMQ